MSQPFKYLAAILARGGSKRFPRKNLALFRGEPLVLRAVRTALRADVFCDVAVSSDDEEILEVARHAGARVHRRTEESSGDNVSSETSLRHLFDWMMRDGVLNGASHCMLLQPTSPLRTEAHIRESVRRFEASGAASLWSVVESEWPAFKMCTLGPGDAADPVSGWDRYHMPKDMLPKTYRPNGAIYIFNIAEFLGVGSIYNRPAVLYPMAQDVSVDVDFAEDLRKAERIA
jgi:CMP-N-acetylneuraminic acid synthetase